MKLAITGSGGTGKSTLAAQVAVQTSWPRINEGVREYLQAHNITK